MIPTRKFQFFSFLFLGILLITFSVYLFNNATKSTKRFNGARAYQDVLNQVVFGPRTPESTAHANAIAYIRKELEKVNWNVQIQETEWQGFRIQNIIASRSELSPSIIIGAHYDSRILADQDTGVRQKEAVPGANDGASGVAVLLELARVIPYNTPPIEFIFFDAEDNGGIANRQWIMGSQAFVASLTNKPKSVVIVDMIGDSDLNICIETNSDSRLVSEIWSMAAKIGNEKYFIATPKYTILDDHIPFLEAGIPAVDIIDFDYPYWHTVADTSDKVSARSLEIVGNTLLAWLETQK
jgi:glutaminyl-peptide cyclotransferase